MELFAGTVDERRRLEVVVKGCSAHGGSVSKVGMVRQAAETDDIAQVPEARRLQFATGVHIAVHVNLYETEDRHIAELERMVAPGIGRPRRVDQPVENQVDTEEAPHRTEIAYEGQGASSNRLPTSQPDFKKINSTVGSVNAGNVAAGAGPACYRVACRILEAGGAPSALDIATASAG